MEPIFQADTQFFGVAFTKIVPQTVDTRSIAIFQHFPIPHYPYLLDEQVVWKNIKMRGKKSDHTDRTTSLARPVGDKK